MAKEMVWSKVKQVPGGVYRVVFEQYSAYCNNWSVCERDIEAGDEDDAMLWAKDFCKGCYEFWKQADCKNEIRIASITRVSMRPGFPSRAAARRELALEGYRMDD